MEIPNPNNFEQEPDLYKLTDEEIRRNFAQDKEAFGVPQEPEAQDTLETLEDEPDYVEKLTMTPLSLDTMQGLLGQMESEYDTGDAHQDLLFKQQFVGAMKGVLARLAQDAKPGDNITFDDLSWFAEDAIGHNEKINTNSILNDPSFVSEVSSMNEINDAFAKYFDQRPDLEYIGDNIDAYTIHSDVHPYLKERIEANPNGDFHGEEHGDKGRWIPERRGNMTVWVTKEQKQHEQKQDTVQLAREALEQVYDANNPDITQPEQSQEEQSDDDPQTELLANVPDTRRERVRFARENFTGKINVQEKTPLLAAFLKKEVADIADQVPEGARYNDNVAAVVGNGGDTWHILKAVVEQKSGKQMEPNEFSRLPFSQVAQELGFDVRKVVPDYDQRFNHR